MIAKKTRLIATLMILTRLLPVTAQSTSFSFSCGFNAVLQAAVPGNSNTWVLGGGGEPFLGAFAKDTLFWAVVRSDGSLLQRKNLQQLPPAANYRWLNLTPLPDGGILACFEAGPCDVFHGQTVVQRYDAAGNLIWQIQESGDPTGFRLPERWFLTADSNLIGYHSTQIWKLDAATGKVIRIAGLQGAGTADIQVSGMQLIPDTEDFIATGTPSFQLWKKSPDTQPVYTLEQSRSVPVTVGALKVGPDGWMYCLADYPLNNIFRISRDLEIEKLPIEIAAGTRANFVPGAHYLYVLEGQPNRLRRFDFQGHTEEELIAPDDRFKPRLAAGNQQIALFGEEGTGHFPSSNHPPGSAAWLAFFPENGEYLEPDRVNVALTAIDQVSGLGLLKIDAEGDWETSYHLEGGAFRIKVINRGAEMVESLCCNVFIGENEHTSECSQFNEIQRCFHHLNLTPGDSVWLNFGDIWAYALAEPPAECCFWLSSPNNRPDAQPEDDIHCKTLNYTLKSRDSSPFAPIVYPNPADTYAKIHCWPESGNSTWQLLDLSGRVLQEEWVITDGNAVVNTASLGNGIYILRVGARAAKLAVHHYFK